MTWVDKAIAHADAQGRLVMEVREFLHQYVKSLRQDARLDAWWERLNDAVNEVQETGITFSDIEAAVSNERTDVQHK